MFRDVHIVNTIFLVIAQCSLMINWQRIWAFRHFLIKVNGRKARYRRHLNTQIGATMRTIFHGYGSHNILVKKFKRDLEQRDEQFGKASLQMRKSGLNNSKWSSQEGLKWQHITFRHSPVASELLNITTHLLYPSWARIVHENDEGDTSASRQAEGDYKRCNTQPIIYIYTALHSLRPPLFTITIHDTSIWWKEQQQKEPTSEEIALRLFVRQTENRNKPYVCPSASLARTIKISKFWESFPVLLGKRPKGLFPFSRIVFSFLFFFFFFCAFLLRFCCSFVCFRCGCCCCCCCCVVVAGIVVVSVLFVAFVAAFCTCAACIRAGPKNSACLRRTTRSSRSIRTGLLLWCSIRPFSCVACPVRMSFFGKKTARPADTDSRQSLVVSTGGKIDGASFVCLGTTWSAGFALLPLFVCVNFGALLLFLIDCSITWSLVLCFVVWMIFFHSLSTDSFHRNRDDAH